MYERFRIRVDTQTTDSPQDGAFRAPPPVPESSNLEPAPSEPQRRQSPETDAADSAATGNGRGNAEQGMELEGVYIISVAARILDMHPQTLRKYERLGLINPGRTVGMLRLYSREDIRKVLLIRHLTENLGLNLAGVEFALNLVDNLQGFKGYLQSAAQGTPLEAVIEPAMAQLFRNLNLPMEE